MNPLINTTDATSNTALSDLSSTPLPFSMDCSPFLNWDEETRDSEHEWGVVFWSLVATLKLRPALDVTLEVKAAKFLKYVSPRTRSSTDAFLNKFASNSGDPLTNFVQSLVVLLSSTRQIITTAAMKMLKTVMDWGSTKILLTLVKADLIPQLITTLNSISPSFAKAQDISVLLLIIIPSFLWLATPTGLAKLGIEDGDEQQAVHETVLTQVLEPSEPYICHLCANRFSIVTYDLSENFLDILAKQLTICPYNQHTMDYVLHLPVVLTIPSCLSFFDNEMSIWSFLFSMVDAQERWDEQGGEERQRWNKVLRMLRMEGFEDAIEPKLRNDEYGKTGNFVVSYSIEWNNLLGMNVPQQK
ncbi:hypothetical protein BLNAU_6876 [Blattamonas nauphoetae]|uniref:Uncharacterized protein n=1 Tax=Blattamonas nauphoetae TaxID=2049346 RepID=A0ABQ9Y351_9EUKA|nr:hypothetical protein BLNAU_6876 [Blattamonas nauphoetae]